jgi:hypothetical protein
MSIWFGSVCLAAFSFIAPDIFRWTLFQVFDIRDQLTLHLAACWLETPWSNCLSSTVWLGRVSLLSRLGATCRLLSTPLYTPGATRWDSFETAWEPWSCGSSSMPRPHCSRWCTASTTPGKAGGKPGHWALARYITLESHLRLPLSRNCLKG